jgi:glycosyltransferase involved in cell wall biosynthesis
MARTPLLSVVAAAHNEEENVARLVREIDAALGPAGTEYEVIVVDDGSTDSTLTRLTELRDRHARLRVLKMRHTPPGRGAGQAAAFAAGIRAARGEFVVTIDADCQNDPADIPAMVEALHAHGADLVQGDRSRARRDSLVRRISSRVGRLSRRILLGDMVRDTGCSLRLMRRTLALQLPLEYRGMHRFIPLTAAQLGGKVVEMDVHHRPRTAGRTKYGIGNRAFSGLIDCFAVRWMRSRRRDASFDEMETAAP